ncbi:iron reductase domain protein [Zopfia rhizophila CBS 207.26]|uniref:Iron reductase domain protein n=1 Tax=Zopfia rhizophila CBS 207.26 TaxID=1314779 RepID=A0A6A6E9F7_9PEZI|nr:iron reductase domain protein [Zopfia rhizophila CBS 207.26]
MFGKRLLGTILATFAASTTIATSSPSLRRDGDESESTHSAFVYDTTYGNLTFAFTAVQDVGDLYFHLEAPADASWIAIGTGSRMANSLMLVFYRTRDEKGVILSPRTVGGHLEPSYDNKIDCQLNTGNGITNGIIKHNERHIYAVNGYCKGVNGKTFRKRHGDYQEGEPGDGKLDFNNVRQSFIFALGPTDRHLHSDSKSANIRRHSLFGRFTVDLPHASVDKVEDVKANELSAVGTWHNHNAEMEGEPKKDNDWGGAVHSLMMGGTFVVLFPMGVVFLRLLEKVKWHAWVQGAGMVIVVMGVGLGLYLGRFYNHSRHIHSAHQILGLIIVSFVILQFSLGFLHHRLYKKHQRPTIVGRIHLYAGPFVLVLGAANGFLGFQFSGGWGYRKIMYGVILTLMFIGLAVMLFWVGRRKSRKEKSRAAVGEEAFEPFSHHGQGQWQGEQHMGDVRLGNIPNEPPPEYDAIPAQPRAII